jgi:hypothetical protein
MEIPTNNDTREDNIILSVFLTLIFILGFLAGHWLFPKKVYIAEDEATKKCEELGGDLDIGYNWNWEGNKINGSKLIYTCRKPSEILFETK